MKKILPILIGLACLASVKPCKLAPAPQNFSVYVDSFADQQPHVNIVWTPNKPPPAQYFEVQRADELPGGGFGPWQTIALLRDAGLADYSVDFGVGYLYRIGAAKNCGTSYTDALYFKYCGGFECP